MAFRSAGCAVGAHASCVTDIKSACITIRSPPLTRRPGRVLQINRHCIVGITYDVNSFCAV
ncbi:hypothetical protein BaRGS_00027910, partial [Batillaria attramentaria]